MLVSSMLGRSAVGATARIFQGLFDAATYMDLRRLPELFCGFPVFAVADRRFTRSPAHRRRGPAVSFLHCCRPRSASSRTPSKRSSDFAIRNCRPFSTASSFVDSKRVQGMSIFQYTVITMPRSPLKFWRHAAISKSSRDNYWLWPAASVINTETPARRSKTRADDSGFHVIAENERLGGRELMTPEVAAFCCRVRRRMVNDHQVQSA
jgi:hypothetical protein